MKKASYCLFIILINFFITTDVFAQTANIIVKINGIDELKGKVFIGLYNKAEDFPKIKRAFKGQSVRPDNRTIKYIFSDIPNGEYAIAVIHDKNSNGELDANFLGIPTEGYCFSKND